MRQECIIKGCGKEGVIETGLGYVCSEECKSQLVKNVFIALAFLPNPKNI